jgi:RND superfamily putative drug exporter
MSNLAARMGRWSATHWKTALFGWILFVAAAFSLTFFIQTRDLTSAEDSSGNSKVAEEIIAGAGFPEHAGESVIIQHPSLRADDPPFVAVVRDAATRIGRTPNVQSLQAPTGPDARQLISKDGHSALINFQVPGSDSQVSDRVAPALDQVRELQRAHPGYVIGEFGDASANRELGAAIDGDLRRAEQLSLPITLLVLLVAFGALVAATIPVVLAFTAVLATYGISALASHLLPSANATSSVILLIGMAVGTDYSLFYLRREREEVAAGRDRASALRIAAATSGQAVLISGATVIVAMAGMLLAGNGTFQSIGVGTMAVVLVAMVGSLTVLPALLSKLGNRVERGRIPFLRRRGAHQARGGWTVILDRVLRRPLVSALTAATALVLLAVPALGLRTKTMGLNDLPKDLPIIATYQRFQAAFPGSFVPAVVAVRAGDVTAPQVRAAIDDLHRRAVASGRMSEPVQVQVNPAKTVALVNIPLAGDGENRESIEALQTLRQQIIPATVGKLPGATVGVTGETAGTKDFTDQMRSRAPLVFGFVLGLAFLLLFGDFPVDRDPDQVDPAEPAQRGRQLRRPGPDLPARLGRVPHWCRPGRRDHFLAAAVPVRGAVRAVHGLSHLHPQPGEGAGGPGRADAGGGRARHQGDRGHGDQRGRGHGGGVRDLRRAAADRHQAGRRRSGDRGAAGRHHHPRRPATGHDGVARRVELVSAQVAEVAAPDGSRGPRRAPGRGRPGGRPRYRARPDGRWSRPRGGCARRAAAAIGARRVSGAGPPGRPSPAGRPPRAPRRSRVWVPRFASRKRPRSRPSHESATAATSARRISRKSGPTGSAAQRLRSVIWERHPSGTRSR